MRLAALILLTAATAGCQSHPHATSAETRSGGSVALFDSGLNMSSGTLSYPAGWQAQGEMNRASPCAQGDPFPLYRVSNQSQQMSILHMVPFFTFSSQGSIGTMNIRSCGTVSQLTHASDILQRLIAPQLTHALQGAQVSQPEPVPGNPPSNGNEGGFRTSSDAARVRVSYTEQGQPREEWIIGSTTVTYFPGGMGGLTKTVVTIISAPQGKLEQANSVAMTGLGIKVNPQWMQANSQIDEQKTAMIQQQGKQTQAAIYAQGQQNMQNSIERSNQTIDQIHRTGNASMQAAKNSADALHEAAMGTAAYVGDKTLVYYWRNTVTGATTTTTTRNAPGANWVPDN